ncbi:hypothetical protein V2H45_11910 [Tumidithrix elongata RA019]|uniref:Uncharacterized protein n=1 Tax=Tumidithrix elongata BACA0141 TaxID=2716417 RepID=A0AAW9Q2N0_9CYAN|nr:hypothetical protein [Tumidithrix elongata RA019]
MSVEITIQPTTQSEVLPSEVILGWEPTPPPTDLIFDDGEPLETNRHHTVVPSCQTPRTR